MDARWSLCLVLPLAACAPTGGEPPPDAPAAEAARAPAGGEEATAASETCVVGTLTEEGVECPALNTVRGEIYTLIGDLGGHGTRDLVCACGEPVEMSTCMQGTTLRLTRIGSPSLCP